MEGDQDNERNPCLAILVVDDEPVALRSMLRIVRKEGHHADGAATGTAAIALVRERAYDIILTDLVLGDANGLEILAGAKGRDPAAEVIIITGHGSVTGAIEATKKGAFHYILKPVRADELRHVVRQAVEKRRLCLRVSELERERVDGLPDLLGTSPKFAAVKDLVRQLQGSDANVLITGESGTGKEMVARAIHATSRRRDRRFLAFNCASLTDELLANELFGHEKDAFTGATNRREGLIESAKGGTVFLDEVGDMSPAMQAKLLRVVQERELIHVGGTIPVPVDVRIIAATNKDLKALCAAGIFRRDLYFRLAIIPIHLPSLAERRVDIPLLASYFLRRSAARAGKNMIGISDEAMGLLMNYGYPGNVRELENIIERATALARTENIETADLPPDMKDFDAFTLHKDGGKIKTLEEIELEYIRWVFDRVGNNKSEAARALGIDRVSLYRKLKKHEFDD